MPASLSRPRLSQSPLRPPTLQLCNSSTLEPFNSCTIRPHFRVPCLFLSDVFYLSGFHGQRRERSKSSRNVATRLPGAHSAQHRPQSDCPITLWSLLSTDHKVIGLNYLWLALFSVFLGLAMSLLMRIHLVWPGIRLPFLSGSSPERYAALTTFHASLIAILVLPAAPHAGFGNYFL